VCREGAAGEAEKGRPPRRKNEQTLPRSVWHIYNGAGDT